MNGSTINNYVYTNLGIHTVETLLQYIEAHIPFKVLTFNTNFPIQPPAPAPPLPIPPEYLSYELVDISGINKIDGAETYETKFHDLYTNRTSICHLGKTSELFVYNVLDTDNNPIIGRNIQIVRYLRSNIKRPKLGLGWRGIHTLQNYANKLPNIALGDSLVKYVTKYYRSQNEPVYQFFKTITTIDENGIETQENIIVPIFTSLTLLNHIMVLVK